MLRHTTIFFASPPNENLFHDYHTTDGIFERKEKRVNFLTTLAETETSVNGRHTLC